MQKRVMGFGFDPGPYSILKSSTQRASETPVTSVGVAKSVSFSGIVNGTRHLNSRPILFDLTAATVCLFQSACSAVSLPKSEEHILLFS